MTGAAGSNGVQIAQHSATVLHGNPLGDPTERDVVVITPPGYDAPERAHTAYPVVFWLAGFGSRGGDLLHGHALGPNLAQRLTAAMCTGELPAAIVVLPDCSTRYGGSQYLDSPGCGRYQSYLVDELVPFIDARFRTLGAGRRAIGGKSSGGYGAILAAMQRPGVFDAVCAHSPDAGFEFSYLSLLPAVLDAVRARGGFADFADELQSIEPKDGGFMVAASLVGMAACYADAPFTGGAGLAAAMPCDPETGRFRDRVWRRWLGHDPVRLAAWYAEALRGLGTFYLDVGAADDYAMHWGARALHGALVEAGVPHAYSEHAGGHHGIEHRFVRSLSLVGRQWAAQERACAASQAS